MVKFKLLEVNGCTPEDIIKEEKLIIESLKVENKACEGCKQEAIYYHNAIKSFMEHYIENYLKKEKL